MEFPLPPLNDIRSSAHLVRLPMTVRFRGVTWREALLIEGPAGWGECAPFLEYEPQEASRWLRSALTMAWQGPPTPLRQSVPVNGTIPALRASDSDERDTIRRLVESFDGVSTIKIKVAEPGQTVQDDCQRVNYVHHLAPQAKIRVDVNAAWTPDEAVAAIPQLVEAAGGDEYWDYVEQPCRTIQELDEVRRRLPAQWRIAADESVRRAEDPLAVIRAGVVDHVVVKVAPLGGPQALVDIARQAPQGAVTVSSALDSAVGISAGIAAAAALPQVAACGLATGQFFAEDVATPHRPLHGQLPYRMVEPCPRQLQALCPGRDRVDWWMRRLSDLHEELCRQADKRTENCVYTKPV